MIKVVTFFLIAMLILGLFGKLRMPRLPGGRKDPKIPAARKCRRCGAYVVGKGPCACEKKS